MTDSQTARTLTTLTLDTNLLTEHWMEGVKAAVVQQLLCLADRKQVDLAVTTRIHADIPFAPMADHIPELPKLKIQEIGSITRVGYWRIGQDKFGSEDFKKARDAVAVQWQQSGQKMPDVKRSGSSPWALSGGARRVPDVGQKPACRG